MKFWLWVVLSVVVSAATGAFWFVVAAWALGACLL